MFVRKALEIDTEQIFRIAQEGRLNYQDPQSKGFLVYGLSKEGYHHRIQRSEYFYVVEIEKKVQGFLMCYDKLTLASLIEERHLNHEDGIVDFLLRQKEDFVFGDQIAVVDECRRKGVGEKLLGRCFLDMKINVMLAMYVGVLHQPVMNKYSRKFCISQGFEEVCEVENSDKLVWGMYEILLNFTQSQRK